VPVYGDGAGIGDPPGPTRAEVSYQMIAPTRSELSKKSLGIPWRAVDLGPYRDTYDATSR